ncbi:MAG TPA: DUF1415 family protein [Candidatus Methylomirabilis sp.]|nr:DUF1415 family protein [Candidatus Methylomirabilis sp.]
MERSDQIIAAMLEWSRTFIERPHEVTGGLPVCPFAKAARLKRAIRFEVLPFDTADPLEPTGRLLCLMRDFRGRREHDTLFLIHPYPRGISARALEAFVVRLNARLAEEPRTRDLQAFEAHPESDFRIGDAYTRRSPHPSLQVLSRSLLKAASDSLLGSHYYDRFSPTTLTMVGMPHDV